MKNRILLTIVFLLVSVAFAQAQSTFAPDRPGLGDGSYVIQPKAAYLELGIEYFEGGAVDQFSVGQVMIRYGIIQDVELRLSLNSYVVQTYPGDNQTGVEDPGMGLKFNLYDNPESPLTVSGLAAVSIPLGYSPFTSNKWVPSATLIADYQLTEYWGVNSNLGYSFGPDEIPDQIIFTVTPGFAFGESPYGGYFGYAGFYSEADSQHFIEAGITRVVGNDVQFDVNTGIETGSGNVFIGAGFAVRF